MPISERRRAGPVTAAAIAACLLLPACLPAVPLPGPQPFLSVAGGEVTIVGPAGYCVDSRTERSRLAGTFVVLGDCGILGGGTPAANPAVLMALVSAAGDLPQAPSAAQLEEYFRSEAGQAALSHDGTAATVTLLEIAAEGDVLYLKVRDGSAGYPGTLDATSWRAVLSLRDRLVALTVASHAEVPVGDLSMRRTLRDFVAAVIAANGGGTGDA